MADLKLFHQNHLSPPNNDMYGGCSGRVDQHTAAGIWLEGFRQWNEHILSEHTIQQPYTFGHNKEKPVWILHC